ncbi:MAG: hypothetical protein HQL67_10390 [Magnetococcales bacterium]|nr:hypothetical protein [Magnetococcales bacterium]
MKKSLVLGAAALAAVAAAPQADAADVKLGGYYQIRFTDADLTLSDVGNPDDTQVWQQRIHLNLDAKISDKTSVHYQWRPLGSSDVVEGANQSDASNGSTDEDIKRLWMETEMYGVGVKAGNMPLSINDSLLFKDDGGSYGTVLLAKSFGDVTVVGLNVRADEGASATNDDEADVYGLSLLGKVGNINYQLTWAHLDVDANYVAAAATAAVTNASTAATGATVTVVTAAGAATLLGADVDDDWLALTMGTEVSGIKLTGTLIWESGLDATGSILAGPNQMTGDGLLAAVRASGKTGFGGWNGYAFYAGEDFTHPMSFTGNRNYEEWSPTWQQGGAGGTNLMQDWATSVGGGSGNEHVENMWAVGLGMSVKAGAWTIKPYIDYAAIVDDTPNNGALLTSDSALGGSLIATTSLDEGTTFSLIAKGVNPSETTTAAANAVENMHSLQAEFTVKF